jgi:hypothetical protein
MERGISPIFLERNAMINSELLRANIHSENRPNLFRELKLSDNYICAKKPKNAVRGLAHNGKIIYIEMFDYHFRIWINEKSAKKGVINAKMF